jgi:hypothetical protein
VKTRRCGEKSFLKNFEKISIWRAPERHLAFDLTCGLTLENHRTHFIIIIIIIIIIDLVESAAIRALPLLLTFHSPPLRLHFFPKNVVHYSVPPAASVSVLLLM